MPVGAIQIIQYVLQASGTLLSAIGTIIVLYTDIPYPLVRSVLRKLTPKGEDLQHARESFEEGGRITEEDEVIEAERIFEARYRDIDEDSTPEKVQETSTSIRIEYPNGNRHSNGFKNRESGRVEKRRFFDWGIRRYYTKVGMLYIFVGFFILFLGVLITPLSW